MIFRGIKERIEKYSPLSREKWKNYLKSLYSLGNRLKDLSSSYSSAIVSYLRNKDEDAYKNLRNAKKEYDNTLSNYLKYKAKVGTVRLSTRGGREVTFRHLPISPHWTIEYLVNNFTPEEITDLLEDANRKYRALPKELLIAKYIQEGKIFYDEKSPVKVATRDEKIANLIGDVFCFYIDSIPELGRIAKEYGKKEKGVSRIFPAILAIIGLCVLSIFLSYTGAFIQAPIFNFGAGVLIGFLLSLLIVFVMLKFK
jgi:hypothetical protein